MGALDDLLGKKGGQLSPRELSLAANSLWYRGRWAESLELFQKTAPHWPEAVKPYGRLVTLLGLERTGRTEEAIAYGEKILPQASGETGYYIAYALYRMTPEKDAAAKKKYLQKMYSHAVNQSQQTAALTGLLALPGDKTAYALNLLGFLPRNSAALKVLEAQPKPWSADINFALGYAAYLRGQYAKAVPLLKAVPLDSRNGRKARYYRAFSLYSLKKYGGLLSCGPAGKERVVHAEPPYGGSQSWRRGPRKNLRVLRGIAASAEGMVKARAYYSLSTHASEGKRITKVIALIPTLLHHPHPVRAGRTFGNRVM